MHLDDEDKDAAYNTLSERLAYQDISRIDIVIANAGTAPSFTTTLNTQIESVQACFATNAIGPLQLFHACYSFLKATDAADPRRRKFILMSSISGSIASLDHETYPNTAYAMSKAAANWLAKKLSVEFRDMGLKVGIVHPGYVCSWFQAPAVCLLLESRSWVTDVFFASQMGSDRDGTGSG